MARPYRILILTDHRIHSPVESIYHIAQVLATDARAEHVHVVSRGLPENEAFFQNPADIPLLANAVDGSFFHSPDGSSFTQATFTVSPLDYDVVMLRLPRAKSMDFFASIGGLIPEAKMINQPSGIALTGNKEYLLHFPELCPPMQYCSTVEEVEAFAARFPIVLKPLNSSGGKGIVRIDGDTVMVGAATFTWADFLPQLREDIGQGYLGMKFLKNVDQGDKRIIVINDKVVAASLRLPADGAWLCNVSMGGSSQISEPDADELAMARVLIPAMQERGVVMFGFDTLVDDGGKRVLSELNTSCVNGIYPAQQHSGKPVVADTVHLLWDYITTKIAIQ